jgi:prolipoprotein diacylglyceryl transferase
MTTGYIIWNATPQLIDLGKFEIRYYSLLFALGFILSYIILLRVFKRKGIPVEILDRLTIYMVIGTIAGARIGHCLFYEFDYYIRHPLEIILPWRGSPGNDFEFTGFQGLASHGAAIGILISIYLFARKTKFSFLWTMDMLVIVTAMAGGLIRLGNLMNSEIYGNPTNNHSGFVFTHDASRLLLKRYDGLIDRITYQKVSEKDSMLPQGVPVQINICFSRKIKDINKVQAFGEQYLPSLLAKYDFDNNVFLLDQNYLPFSIDKENHHFWLRATVGATPRYPTQLYEAASYFTIFLILGYVFILYEKRLRNGYLLGMFLVLVFSARFGLEFLKQNQESFEDAMMLNMGQILSLPFIAAGILLMILKWPKNVPIKS